MGWLKSRRTTFLFFFATFVASFAPIKHRWGPKYILTQLLLCQNMYSSTTSILVCFCPRIKSSRGKGQDVDGADRANANRPENVRATRRPGSPQSWFLCIIVLGAGSAHDICGNKHTFLRSEGFRPAVSDFLKFALSRGERHSKTEAG